MHESHICGNIVVSSLLFLIYDDDDDDDDDDHDDHDDDISGPAEAIFQLVGSLVRANFMEASPITSNSWETLKCRILTSGPHISCLHIMALNCIFNRDKKHFK